MKIETRKTRLLMHLYKRIIEEADINWLDELDAIDDVLSMNREGMKEWTVSKTGKITFK